MHITFISTILLGLILAGCMHDPIHQGNRLDNNKGNMISVGDTKFTIEQKLGSPVLKSILHPNRVTYFEQFEDEGTGDIRKRGIEIIYDDALRAKEIRRFGFAEKNKPSESEK